MANPLSNQKVMQKTIGTLILIVFIFLVLAFQAAGDALLLKRYQAHLALVLTKLLKKQATN